MTTDEHNWVSEAYRTLYEPGNPVWVGRSRGSEREGTVLRYLGEGFYSVSVAGQQEARILEEGLLRPRQEDEAG